MLNHITKFQKPRNSILRNFYYCLDTLVLRPVSTWNMPLVPYALCSKLFGQCLPNSKLTEHTGIFPTVFFLSFSTFKSFNLHNSKDPQANESIKLYKQILNLKKGKVILSEGQKDKDEL